MKVTCMSLWINWKNWDPNSRFVLEATERMKQYKKSDWETMALEATELVEKMANLVKNNVSIEDEQSKQILIDLCKHLSDWFFVPDHEYFSKILLSVKFDVNYQNFFNQFYPGTSNYLKQIIERYQNEIVFIA